MVPRPDGFVVAYIWPETLCLALQEGCDQAHSPFHTGDPAKDNKAMTRLALLVTMLLSVSAAQADTLEQVRQRGFVNCGVRMDAQDFSPNRKPTGWAGMELDFCRAVAAAVFGAPDKFKEIGRASCRERV
jgi:hypothetical protein